MHLHEHHHQHHHQHHHEHHQQYAPAPAQHNNSGYHYREGVASSNPNSLRRSKMDFIATKWPRAFFATAAVQAIICLAFEA